MTSNETGAEQKIVLTPYGLIAARSLLPEKKDARTDIEKRMVKALNEGIAFAASYHCSVFVRPCENRDYAAFIKGVETVYVPEDKIEKAFDQVCKAGFRTHYYTNELLTRGFDFQLPY